MASLAAASLVFRQSNPAYATRLLNKAIALYGDISTVDQQGSYSNIKQTGCRNLGDPDVVRSAVVVHPLSIDPNTCRLACTAAAGWASGRQRDGQRRQYWLLCGSKIVASFRVSLSRLSFLPLSQLAGGVQLPHCGLLGDSVTADNGGVGSSPDQACMLSVSFLFLMFEVSVAFCSRWAACGCRCADPWATA